MKKLLLPFTAILLACSIGPVSAGYQDLRQEMEDYSPPAVFQSESKPVREGSYPPDTFAMEKKNIDAARDRWTQIVQESKLPVIPASVSPTIVDAARDDVQTRMALQDHFSLPMVQAFILLRNPAIAGAVTRFKAAIEGFSQVTQLDEILRQYSAFTESVMVGVGPARASDNIRMKFPFPGVAALKGQIAEKNAETAQYQSALIRRDIVSQGSKAYWNLLFIHQARRVTRETLGWLDHLESVTTTLYEAGKAGYQNLINIQIRSEKLGELLVTYKKQQRNLEIELLTLMNLPPEILLGRPATTIPNNSVPELDRLYPLALENRQELKRMRAMVGKIERMVEMAETMIQPSFSQGYSHYADKSILQVGSNRMKPTFTQAVSPSFGKGLPKNAWFGSQDAFLRETRLKLNALRSELLDAESRTRLMVRNGWFDLDRAHRERILYKNRLINLSRASLEISTVEYESGRIAFSDVIESYTRWLDLNLAGERRNSDLGIAWAELERRMGVSLPSKPKNN